jgi:hypothetical protein
MLTEWIDGHEVQVYNSIAELPIDRFMLFNRQILIDSGVGHDLEDVSVKVTKIIRLIDQSPDKAKVELINLSGTLANAIRNVNPKMGAFVALIYSIDGVPLTDMSMESINDVQELLGGAKMSWLNAIIKKFRRLFRREMYTFFKTGNSGPTKSYYENLKQRLILNMRQVAGDEVEEDIKKLEEAMEQTETITKYLGDGGMQVRDIAGGEQSLATVSKYMGTDAKDMTVMEFYTVVEMIKKAAKKK